MPVVCDKLVYLELQKTACTTIGGILEALFEGEALPPKHGTLPDPATTKLVVGSVRNPWDYYVSLWAFGCQGRGNFHRVVTRRDWAAARAALPAPHRLLTEATRPAGRWRRRYAEPNTPEQFRSWLRLVHTPSAGRQFEPEYGASAMRRFAGYATYRYCRLYAKDPRRAFDAADMAELERVVAAGALPGAMIRTEHLADDLVAAVRAAGYDVGDALERAIRERASATKANASARGPYTDYYDEATRDLVGRRDELVVTRHGYRFGA